MQKTIDSSYMDWTRGQKTTIRSRGIASIVLPQLKLQSASAAKISSRCVWPSGA